MALFNRKKSQTISELEDYYANRNNSTGRAWLMALLSLLVTVVVLTALFFGGRWVYRSLTNDDVKVVTTSNGSSVTNTDSTIETTNPSTGTPTSEPNGVVSDEAATTTNTNSSSSSTSASHTAHNTASTAASTTPVTGESADLPNTGAGSFLFFATSIAFISGVFIARKKQLR